MDTLSALLSLTRVEASLFSRAALSAPWGVETFGGVAGKGIFHAVMAGQGELVVAGEPTRRFGPGDVLLLPHGDAHVLRDAADSPVRHIGDWPSERGEDGLPCLVGGGGGAELQLLCGACRFDAVAREALLPALPRVIHVNRGPTAAWLGQTLGLLAGELDLGRPGSAVMVARLTDLVFVGVLRAWVEQGEASQGWAGALADPQLARAVAAIHDDPARAWTTRELARVAGMSRSAFYVRFSERVGEPPAAYLTRWRMAVARAALQQRDLPLIAVAERVGYGSEAAFSRAFKRATGLAPSRWRARAA